MTFRDFVNLIIDNIEGGYFHPKMLLDGRVTDQRYKNSGETWGGFDRLNGGDINTSAAGQQFWSLIDNADASDKWPWNYMGGDLEAQLRDLAAQMIYPVYVAFCQKFLSAKALAIVNTDARLTFHFIYAAWNGNDWFDYFAIVINQAVDKGTINPDDLVKIAIDSRVNNYYNNSLIAQGGAKVQNVINSFTASVIDNPVTSGGIIVAFLLGMFLELNNRRKAKRNDKSTRNLPA